MIDSIENALQQAASQPIGLLLAMVLGFLGAFASVCCTLPVLVVMLGYSGVQESADKKQALKKAVFFTIGTIVSLMIIGGVLGFMGQIAQTGLGRYWKIFAGIALIFCGLAALNVLPFKLSTGRFDSLKTRLSASGTLLSGLVLGGAIAISSLCCNPAIFVVIGVAVIQGEILWASLLLGMFAIGFSLPIGALMLGITLGKASLLPKKADAIVRWIAGGLLLVVGFYFLLTL
jgi:cytochrome c biogenesis protein CcdA